MTRQEKEAAILAVHERDAVIAELDRLCKQDGIMEISPGLWVKGYKQYQLSIGWFDCFTIDVDGNERRVFKIHAQLPDSHPYWFVAHLVLRLETRALESEIKRRMKSQRTRIERLRALYDNTHAIHLEIKDERISALEEEVRRLKAGIWELSALVPYPNLALKYLDPPTP